MVASRLKEGCVVHNIYCGHRVLSSVFFLRKSSNFERRKYASRKLIKKSDGPKYQ